MAGNSGTTSLPLAKSTGCVARAMSHGSSPCCWCCADAASLSFASCTGVREKKVAFIGVKVYSVALFVDQAGASAALKSGKSLLTGEFEKLLSIKLAMKVGG